QVRINRLANFLVQDGFAVDRGSDVGGGFAIGRRLISSEVKDRTGRRTPLGRVAFRLLEAGYTRCCDIGREVHRRGRRGTQRGTDHLFSSAFLCVLCGELLKAASDDTANSQGSQEEQNNQPPRDFREMAPARTDAQHFHASSLLSHCLRAEAKDYTG